MKGLVFCILCESFPIFSWFSVTVDLFALICYCLIFNMTVFLEFRMYDYMECKAIKLKGWWFVGLFKPFLLALELTQLYIFQAFIGKVASNQHCGNKINRK